MCYHAKRGNKGGKNNDFSLDDLLFIARENAIKESWAKDVISHTVEIVSGFEQRAKSVNLRNDFVKMVSMDLRLDMV